MAWDFAEINPLANLSGSFSLALKAEVDAIRGLSKVLSPSICQRTRAQELPYTDDSMDAVVTDPPYYDNMSYADLSDFFYVWLKRTVGDLYPDHFGSDQTPKKHEATVVPYRHGGDGAKARGHYEALMTAAFLEAGRVVKPNGPVVVVYAHKTVAGWGSLVDALRSARCAVTEAWPLRTESETRLRARNSAALATSIFLVARKRIDETVCDDYEGLIVPRVRDVISERIETLWESGIHGTADLVVAVLGAALGPFTRYVKVRRPNGEEVSTPEFLEDTQRAVIDAILKKILRESNLEGASEVSVAGIDPTSRLYVVARLQLGETATEFDIFKNLAIGALPSGTELEGIRGSLMQGTRALLSKKGNKVALRSFEERGTDPALGLYRRR